MKKTKKVNPRRKPVTHEDVRKAVDKATKLSIAIFLFVLAERFDFNKEQIRETLDAVVKLSEEVKERRISREDIIGVLEEEYNIKELR